MAIRNNAPLFGRVATAMVTPFKDDLSCDWEAVDKLVDHLVSNGTDTIVVAGTTGESPTLEDDEKVELVKRVSKANKSRAKIVVGTGSNSTAKTVKASKEAEALGADGLLVVAPYYNKPSQDGLLAHYDAVLKAINIPVIAYNIPGRTGININAETLIELAKCFPNLHAVKDSTGSVDQASEIARGAHENFRIYSGDDYMTLPFLAIGACGVISVASHIAGQPIKKMIDAYFAGNIEQARQIHYQYLPLFRGLFASPNPTCIKYALAKQGLCKANVRLPLVGLNHHQKEVLDTLLNVAGSEVDTQELVAIHK